MCTFIQYIIKHKNLIYIKQSDHTNRIQLQIIQQSNKRKYKIEQHKYQHITRYLLKIIKVTVILIQKK